MRVGASVGSVGAALGLRVVGALLGEREAVGFCVVGLPVGATVVGLSLGARVVGASVGLVLGFGVVGGGSRHGANGEDGESRRG